MEFRNMVYEVVKIEYVQKGRKNREPADNDRVYEPEISEMFYTNLDAAKQHIKNRAEKFGLELNASRWRAIGEWYTQEKPYEDERLKFRHLEYVIKPHPIQTLFVRLE